MMGVLAVLNWLDHAGLVILMITKLMDPHSPPPQTVIKPRLFSLWAFKGSPNDCWNLRAGLSSFTGWKSWKVHQNFYPSWVLPSRDQDERGSQFDKFSYIQEIIKLAHCCQLSRASGCGPFLCPDGRRLPLQAVLMACAARLLRPAQPAGVCSALLPAPGPLCFTHWRAGAAHLIWFVTWNDFSQQSPKAWGWPALKPPGCPGRSLGLLWLSMLICR